MLIKYFHFVEIDKTSKQKKEIRELEKELKKRFKKDYPDWDKESVDRMSTQGIILFLYYTHSFIKEDEIDSIELMEENPLLFSTKEGKPEDFQFFDKNKGIRRDHYGDYLFDISTDHSFFGENRNNKSRLDVDIRDHSNCVRESIICYQITKKSGEIIKWVRSIETILDHSLTMKIDDLNLLLSRLEKIDSNDRLGNISNKLEDIKEILEKLIPRSNDEDSKH